MPFAKFCSLNKIVKWVYGEGVKIHSEITSSMSWTTDVGGGRAAHGPVAAVDRGAAVLGGPLLGLLLGRRLLDVVQLGLVGGGQVQAVAQGGTHSRSSCLHKEGRFAALLS